MDKRKGHLARILHVLRPACLYQCRTAGTDFPVAGTHHPACEEGEQPKEDARRNGTPLPPPLPPRPGRKALGEADILPSRDRREAHHQVRAGNRDNFLFALGSKCYSKGLDEQTAIRLAKNEFGQEYPDVESPLHNAYIYTDKTSEAATKKEEKSPSSTK